MARIKNINFWKICLYCGKKFGANRRTAKYCCPQHNALHHQKHKDELVPSRIKKKEIKKVNQPVEEENRVTISVPKPPMSDEMLEALLKKMDEVYGPVDPYILRVKYYRKYPDKAQKDWERLSALNKKYGWVPIASPIAWRALKTVLGIKED